MIVRSLVLRTYVLKRFFAKYSTGTVPYGILQCTVRYRTGTVLWYGTSKCIYPSRDADYCFCDIIYLFFILLQSSLACVDRGRCSAAARPLLASRAPPTTAAPTLLAIALLAPTISLFSLTTCTSDYIFSLVRCASWSPCLVRSSRHIITL
jgi:hypothetical protein